jgi:predicted metalloprotease
MQLGDQRASSNVEDRRGMGMVGGGLGIGGIVIALIAYFLGVDPGVVTEVAQQVAPERTGGQESSEVPRGTPSDETGQFVAKVLGSTEDVWGSVFRQSRMQYRAPTLVLYDGQVRSACGMGQVAMGPFYCPGDEKLYIDLAFFRDLQTRFRAPGDFAQAYVIAHEVGHHVQKLTGAFQRMEDARASPQAERNRISVRMELQADCYAGVWGHHAGSLNQLDSGDIAEALNAATAIGDDRLQKQAQGRVVPESFTHGSSEQRVRWFRRGLESGRPQDCDTSAASAL